MRILTMMRKCFIFLIFPTNVLGLDFLFCNKFIERHVHKNGKNVFDVRLDRLESLLWIPKQTKNQVKVCLAYALQQQKNIKPSQSFDVMKPMRYFYDKCLDIEQIAMIFKVTINIHRYTNHQTFTSIESQQQFSHGTIYIDLFNVGNRWGYILKPYEFKFRWKCHTCLHWFPYKSESQFKSSHLKSCVRCACGKAMKVGDEHLNFCTQRVSNKFYLNHERACKLYSKSKNEPVYNTNSYHADFECIPDAKGNFVVSATAIEFEGQILHWAGPNSLDDFMEFILNNLKGVLWFYNGSRFDDFFILQWLMKHDWPVESKKTMFDGSRLSVLSFKTKKGLLQIKDLLKFFVGSLDRNCKDFKLDQEFCKSSFDFKKVFDWDSLKLHEKELLLYLDQDVRAQSKLYNILAKTIFDLFKQDMTKFVSLSQMSYACFSCSLTQNDLIKTKIQDEDLIRDSYRGGRIVMTRPVWASSLWKDILPNINNPEKLQQIFNELNDYLIYIDANSLYPTVMQSEEYACGDYRIKTNFPPYVLNNLNNPDKSENAKRTWNRRLVEVNVECPKDLLVAFLMSRDKDGNAFQDLEPKFNVVYTGAELCEAVILGYKVTKIHKIFEWDYGMQKKIFEQFITLLYNIKKDSAPRGPKPNDALYQIVKLLMNSLSGKFGQKTRHVKKHILIGEDITINVLKQQKAKQIWINENQEDYFDNVLKAVLIEEPVQLESTAYPVHIASQILGNSRVFMSRLMRQVDGYRNLENCPYYGDTDSLIFHKNVFSQFPKEVIGKDLGTFKDEIPHGKIVMFIVLAPKMYMNVYLAKDKDDQMQLWCQFKSKGIPHSSEPYLVNEMNLVSEEERKKVLEIHRFLQERGSTEEHYAGVNVKDQFFIRCKNGEENEEEKYIVRNKLHLDDVLEILFGGCQVYCHFGRMIRKINAETQISGVGIAIDYDQRQVAKNLWWLSNKRKFPLHPTEDFPMSYPLGHERVEESTEWCDDYWKKFPSLFPNHEQ